MDTSERSVRERAVREGLSCLQSVSMDEQFPALLALRTVAYLLDLEQLHAEIDVRLKAVIQGGL